VIRLATTLATSLVIVLLFGAPILGMFVQPWAPWWFGQKPIADTPITDFAPISTPVPVIGIGQPEPRTTPLIAAAMQWLGTPYLWGGCDRRGVDCSCFVRNVLATVGISAPRTTTEQIRWATPVTRGQLEVGDLLFFNDTCTGCGANPTHVGMYIGGNQMIHAGDPVQISNPFSGFYAAHYAGAGRPR